jgi:glucose/arabinose dehydrogenase
VRGAHSAYPKTENPNSGRRNATALRLPEFGFSDRLIDSSPGRAWERDSGIAVSRATLSLNCYSSNNETLSIAHLNCEPVPRQSIMSERRKTFGSVGFTLLLGMAAGCTTAISSNNSPVAPSAPVAQVTSPASSPTASATTPEANNNAAPVNIRKNRLISNLDHPWGMAWLPDGSLLITERAGRLRLFRNGRLEPTPIAGVPPVFASGQGGLLDIALHPQFAQNRFVYLTYAHGTGEANRTRVARAVFDGQQLIDVRVIFEVSQAKSGGQHFGSRMVWLPDGTMLVAIGDGGNPPVELEGDLIRKQAQNLRSNLGKIIRLNDDGSVPSDNPFVNRSDADPKVWSYGHRNIQGLALNPVTNQVWATEHGARAGDELNRVEAGKNYGWPIVTYSQEYSGGEITQERSRPDMVNPKQVWRETIAPSGLTFYTGDRIPAWRGNLFAGGLVSGNVRRLTVNSAGEVTNEQIIDIGQRVRDVRQGPDGFLYVLTDGGGNGRLIRLEPGS